MDHKTTQPQSRLHVWHGGVMLGLSVLFYLIAMAALAGYNSSHGGGQQTLPGMGEVVEVGLGILFTILAAVQGLLQWRISKRQRLSAMNVLIAVPLLVCLPLALKVVELPARYYNTVFCLLVACTIICCLAMANKQRVVAIGALTGFVATVAVGGVLYGMSSNNSRWWDNGHVVEYNDDGVKIKEYERKVQGVAYGNYTEWDGNGQPTWFRRYPEGWLKDPDSAVNYRYGGVWQMRYSFDSAGHRYERQIQYDLSIDTATTRPLLVDELVDKTAKLYDYQLWWPDTRNWRETYHKFDSNGMTYNRHVFYNKAGKVTFGTTIVDSSDYVVGQTDALY